VIIQHRQRGDRHRRMYSSHRLWRGPSARVRWAVSGGYSDSHLVGELRLRGTTRRLPRGRDGLRRAVAL
jgi:hypothetical protein